MGKVWEFEPNLEYQINAINSVVNLFEGQDKIEYNHISSKRNELTISRTRMEENLINIQKSEYSNVGTWDEKMLSDNKFTIEMETGTGKTYVYLRTMIELHQKYGFNKFILVVPSIPIRMGVEKSIWQLHNHFIRLYNIDLLRSCFSYDSKSGLGKFNQFVELGGLQIVIMNHQAFDKASNILNKEKEDGKVYWDMLKGTKPIVFIDEPQKIIGAKKKSNALKKIEELNPVATFMYSATHTNYFNLIYKLDSFDAFEKDLVKGINVSTIYSDVDKNYPYFRYIKFNDKDLTAKVELLVSKEVGVRLEKVIIDRPCDLYELTNLEQYKGYRILNTPHKKDGICTNFNKNIQTTPYYFSEEESNYSIYEDDMVKVQMKITIQKHLDKQIEMLKHNVKVLSLFFIDEVGKYRDYTKAGASGEYVNMFEELFSEIINSDIRYIELIKNMPSLANAKKVHEGYFAIDKNQKVSTNEDTYNEDKDTEKTREERERGIQKILSGKEKLIQLDEPISFIFAHSALAEGWDNPNVFQLCMLRKSKSNIRKKQEIGRGLRLARGSGDNSNIIRDENVNQLTVIVNEHYEEFANSLQQEYNEEANYNKDAVTIDDSKQIQLMIEKNLNVTLSNEFHKKLHNELLQNGFIKAKDNKIDSSKIQKLEQHNYNDEELNENKDRIFTALKKVMEEKNSKKIKIVNDDEIVQNNFQKYIFEDDFKSLLLELEEKLNKKTVYEVKYTEEELVNNCILEVRNYITNDEFIVTERSGTMDASSRTKGFKVIEQKGNEQEYKLQTKNTLNRDFVDIVNEVMIKTNFTRQIIHKIIMSSNDPLLFQKQDNVDKLVKIIEKHKEKQYHKNREHIQYHIIDETNKIGASNLFLVNEILSTNIAKKKVFVGIDNNKKSVCKYFKTDSDGEYEFAECLENDNNVVLYSKINKGSFIIENPVENYSPDWAIVYKVDNNTAKIFLIMETKWKKEWEDLSDIEKTKIICAKKHFESLNNNIKYDWVNAYEDFKEKVKIN